MPASARPRSTSTPAEEIARYLRTGESDPIFSAWPGESVIPRAQRADAELRAALIAEVERRAAGRSVSVAVPDDLVAFTRAKVQPMVHGLFPTREREVVLRLLERSVVFLTPGSIAGVLRETHWLHVVWDLANLYLGSLGAELLADDAPRIVGLSSETTCFVSLRYFEHEDRFADFVVHEAAHVFHNCKRVTAGLPETRRREWLLDIEYRKRASVIS